MSDRLSHVVPMTIDQMEFLGALLVGRDDCRDILLALQKAIKDARTKEQKYHNAVEMGL